MSAGVLVLAGGSRGIGEAIAVQAAQAGYELVLSYISHEARAEAVVERIRAAGGSALAVRADTAQERDIEQLFDVAARQGPVRAFVYNSAITGTNSTLAEASTSTIDAVLDVNLRGAILGCRAAVRRMSTSSGGEGGAIVLLSSRAALYGSAFEYVWYAATKGGIDSLTIGLSREVAGEGIRVNAVSPGPIATEMHRPGRLETMEQRSPMRRAGTADEAAQAVLFLLSPAASYITGANVAVAGGL